MACSTLLVMSEHSYSYGERIVDADLYAMRAMGRTIGARTARLIAAKLEVAPDSALGRFAFSGEVASDLRPEIAELRVDLLQVLRVEALAVFVDEALTVGTRPSGEHGAGSPLGPTTALQPHLYVAPPGGVGVWIDAAQSAPAFRWALAEVTSAHEVPGIEWTIHASMGFYGFDVSQVDDIDHVLMFGRGIVQHGESFSWFPTFAGSIDEDDLGEFEDHSYGRCISAEQFVMDRAEERGWHRHLGRFVQQHALVGLIEFDVNAVMRAFFGSSEYGTWIHIEGEEGEYVFGPRRGG